VVPLPLRLTAPFMTMSLSISGLAHADAAAVERMSINVAAGRASVSITALADQTHLNVLFRGSLAEDVITNAVSGSLAPSEALRRIVAGTPLTFVMSNERTITVWNCNEFPCDSSDLQPGPRAHREVTATAKPPATDRPIPQVDINGMRAAGDELSRQPSAEKVIVSRDQMDQSGAVTLPEALRTLTQFLNGNVTEGNIPNGREALTNGNHASGVNVRGLGAA
jgi:hypothetical protein